MKAFVLVQYAYIEKEEKSEINNLSFQFRKLEKEKQVKFKLSKGKEIIKIRAEIVEIEIGNQYRRSMIPKASSLKR